MLRHRSLARSAVATGLVLLLAGACGDDNQAPQADGGATPAHTLPPGSPEFGHAKVLIDTESGSTIIDAEVAETDEQRAFGLMHREHLAENAGMIFLYTEEHTGAFYMKDTLIPLSIAFFDADGTIVRILDMEPCHEDPCALYDPGTPYHGALEVNQGAFARLGVGEGDRITVSR